MKLRHTVDFAAAMDGFLAVHRLPDRRACGCCNHYI
jgi:hypothetical protein